jgi:hypothetical protein
MKYRTTQKIKDTILETKLQECRLRPTKTVFKLDTSNPTMPSLDLKIHSLIVFCFFGAIKSPYVPASYLKHKYVCVCVCAGATTKRVIDLWPVSASSLSFSLLV